MAKFIKKVEGAPSRIKGVGSTRNKKTIVEKEEQPPDIEKEVLSRLGKPKDFLKMEIKEVGNKRFRVNVICSSYKPECLMPFISRPKSYYLVIVGDKMTFHPDIVKYY